MTEMLNLKTAVRDIRDTLPENERATAMKLAEAFVNVFTPIGTAMAPDAKYSRESQKRMTLAALRIVLTVAEDTEA